jgi:hypothetical protein
VNLVWAVPVVAAAAATLFVVTYARSVEDEVRALAVEVSRLSALRPRLAALREAAAETDEVLDDFRDRHAASDEPSEP